MSRVIQLWATVTMSAVVGACGTNEPASAGRRDLPLVPTTAPAGCGGHVKEIKVKDITIVSATLATIKVPKRFRINKNKAGANWTLQTSGYVFAPAGVVIDMPPGPAVSYSDAPNEFGWCFDTSADWESKYTLYLRASSSTVIWKCDPMIANFGEGFALEERLVSCSVVP